MRLGAHIGVKDEAGLIGPCVAHLRALGVTAFAVHDIASQDGTREWLRAQEGPGFRVIDVRDDDSEAHLNASVQAAVAGLDADWVLMLDADEFPLARGGDLRAALAHRGEDAVTIPRFNVALGPGGPRLPLPPRPADFSRTDLFALADPDHRRRLDQDSSLAWLSGVPAPKVAVRPSRVGRVGPGGHSAKARAGGAATMGVADGTLIAHLALSDYSRFARKVANARATLAHVEGTVSPNFGWHWRRWVALDDAGGLRAEFDRSVLSEEGLARLRAQGAVRTAADLLG